MAPKWLRQEGRPRCGFLISDFWNRVLRLQAHIWTEYVPSDANIADGPSRPSEPAKIAPLRSLQATRIEPGFPVPVMTALEQGFAL